MKRVQIVVVIAMLAGAVGAARAQVASTQVSGAGVGVAIGGAVSATLAPAMATAVSGSPVTGAPYSATSSNESVQTLADGNRIVQSMTGSVARDSQGRMRQDMPLPALGNLAIANAPHLVSIQDVVAHAMYMLNLTDKSAQKIQLPDVQAIMGKAVAGAQPAIAGTIAAVGPQAGAGPIFIQRADGAGAPPLPMLPPPGTMATFSMKVGGPDAQNQSATEDLGSQTLEGVYVTGTRTSTTIPAGQMGNEQPIKIVNEVWTSPDLKVVVLSKRNDPRIGEQTYKLTNIVRTEPNPSLFTVPADFTVSDGPQNVIYRTNP